MELTLIHYLLMGIMAWAAILGVWEFVVGKVGQIKIFNGTTKMIYHKMVPLIQSYDFEILGQADDDSYIIFSGEGRMYYFKYHIGYHAAVELAGMYKQLDEDFASVYSIGKIESSQLHSAEYELGFWDPVLRYFTKDLRDTEERKKLKRCYKLMREQVKLKKLPGVSEDEVKEEMEETRTKIRQLMPYGEITS